MAFLNVPGIIPDKNDLGALIPIGISAIGTPVWDDVTFPALAWTDKNEVEIFRMNELKLQSVQVSVARATNIVKNQASGATGTIKTYTSRGDYVITVNAILAELLNTFPADQMIIFRKISDAKVAIPVVCRFLNDYHDINNVVIENITTSPKTGSINQVNLSITMSSDFDFDPTQYEVKLK